MPFTPPAHTPFQWQDAPSAATPLDAVNLNAAETDLVGYTQSALQAYDTYAHTQFGGGPYVSATANGVATTNTAAANTTALSALVGASGALASGGTLICDWDGTAQFDCSGGAISPAASLLTVIGRGWGTVMQLKPEASTNAALQLWSLSGTQSIQMRDICLQGPDTLGTGGASMLVRHNGTGGYIKLRNVWARRATFLIELNATTTATAIDADGCWFEGYATVNSTTCIGAFETTPAAWTPTKRVSVANSRFFNFGDPAGGALRHGIYVYTSWGLCVTACTFDTPAATNTGYCAQHFDGGTVTGTAAAQESTFVGCSFGQNLAATRGIFSDANYPTTLSACTFSSTGTVGDVVAGGPLHIMGCKFNMRATQNVECAVASTHVIEGCLFTGTVGAGSAAVYADTNGARVLIVGCNFEGGSGANGYHVFNSSGSSTIIQVSDCRFSGNPNYAVYSITAGRITLRGNRFETAFACIANHTAALTELNVVDNEFATGSGTTFDLAVTPTALYVDRNYGAVGFKTRNGGTSTQTPGAVTTVNIAHGLGNSSLTITPTKLTAEPANAVTAALTQRPALTATTTNVVLTFASALTAATSYAWVWSAEA